jgi:hypothetical protein
VEYYNKVMATNREIEVIHYNHDYNEKAMEGFMIDFSFPWPAIAYKERENAKIITSLYGDEVPSYTLIDAGGRVLANGKEAAEKKIAELGKVEPDPKPGPPTEDQ